MTQYDVPNSREIDLRIKRMQVPSPCRKKAYRTKRKATVARDRIRATQKTAAGANLTRVYRCPDCDLFHVTSQVTR